MPDTMHDAGVTDPHELVAAYALDAVDDIERAQFERHLVGCETCRDELSSFGPVLTGLGMVASEEVPPPRMRTDLLAEIARTPQESPRRELVEQAAEQPVRQRSQHAAHAAHAAPRRRHRALTLLAAAAAAVVVVGGGAVVVNQLSTPSSQVATDATQRVLSAPDARTVQGTLDDKVLRFTVSRGQNAAAVRSDALPTLPSGRTYELWYVDSYNQARSAGLLSRPGSQLLSGGLDNATTVAITVEPTGGSRQPTTSPVVAVPLT